MLGSFFIIIVQRMPFKELFSEETLTELDS